MAVTRDTTELPFIPWYQEKLVGPWQELHHVTDPVVWKTINTSQLEFEIITNKANLLVEIVTTLAIPPITVAVPLKADLEQNV